jgi:xanthine dehydrogenase YagT iron-sulfur-binding subunit
MTEHRALTRDAVRELMSGNLLCRCGAYSSIVDAVMDAMERKGRP